MVKEAIILAGGLGTRLREKVPDLPKCMAPVAGRPFLYYVINFLRSQGIERFIFSLGYRNEMIQEYLKSDFYSLDYICSIETSPLGTGGAILQALSMVKEENCLIANGDTLFKADLETARSFHLDQKADCTILLKPMTDFNRYGIVEMNSENRVTAFKEKQSYKKGNINGGIYFLRTKTFREKNLPPIFSFEKDYLEKHVAAGNLFAQQSDGYFIDIGIPEDYEKASRDLSIPPLDLKKIDKSWTLFLDRDGVINEDAPGTYIHNLSEFHIYPYALGSIKKLSERFEKIFIISNQRGVGRKLMTEADLRQIHDELKRKVNESGGRIDAIYYCTATDNKELCRKPNPGMAFHARRDFPQIDLSKAIMVGNKMTDMLFAKYAGMYSIFVSTTNPETPFPHPDIDLRYDTLADFANSL